jgi:hypothetical protein
MVKKTYYTKGDQNPPKVENGSKQAPEKDAPQINSLIENNKPEKNEIKLNKDEIEKKPKQPKKVMVELETLQGQLKKGKVSKGDKLKPKQYDEQGNLLTSKGKIDKRPLAGIENLKKSRVYQQILANKKLKEEVGKVAVLTPYVDSDESEPEFEEIKLENDPVVPPHPPQPPMMSRTELYLKEQAELRERQLAEQIKKMEDENKKLKDKFQFNSHLNRIQAMSSTVKLKF